MTAADLRRGSQHCHRGPCAVCGGQASTNVPGGEELCWLCLAKREAAIAVGRAS
jgi:hypothetical protein